MTDHYAMPPAHVPVPAPAPARRSNPLGVTSAILGGVLLVTAVINVFTQIGFVMSRQYELIDAITSLISALQSLIAVAAIVTGIIGLVQKDRPRALAGIGLGIGIAVLWENFGALLYRLAFTFGV